jgi:hypothetical protein
MFDVEKLKDRGIMPRKLETYCWIRQEAQEV